MKALNSLPMYFQLNNYYYDFLLLSRVCSVSLFLKMMHTSKLTRVMVILKMSLSGQKHGMYTPQHICEHTLHKHAYRCSQTCAHALKAFQYHISDCFIRVVNLKLVACTDIDMPQLFYRLNVVEVFLQFVTIFLVRSTVY